MPPGLMWRELVFEQIVDPGPNSRAPCKIQGWGPNTGRRSCRVAVLGGVIAVIESIGGRRDPTDLRPRTSESESPSEGGRPLEEANLPEGLLHQGLTQSGGPQLRTPTAPHR